MNELEFQVNDFFERKRVSLKRWEKLLAEGWDRIGKSFLRRRFYYSDYGTTKLECMPLRYNLTIPFEFTKKQKKILAKNQDLKTIIRPLQLDDEQLALFDAWEEYRFQSYSSIHSWIVSETIPFPSYQVCVYDKDRLIAVSYFDIAGKTQYSTIAAYLPEESHRNLGYFTLFKEIEFALQNKRKYHHPGYAYYNNPVFDYKKTIPNAEGYCWIEKRWIPLPILQKNYEARLAQANKSDAETNRENSLPPKSENERLLKSEQEGVETLVSILNMLSNIH